MKFEASTTINAAPEVVWRVLTNADEYPNWDPNMEKLEGTIALGNKITAHVTFTTQAFPVTVSTLDAPSKMVWSSNMPLGTFKGARTFLLTPKEGGTHVHVEEVFSGWMLPIIGRTIPDLTPTFHQFVQGLKERSEGVV